MCESEDVTKKVYKLTINDIKNYSPTKMITPPPPLIFKILVVEKRCTVFCCTLYIPIIYIVFEQRDLQGIDARDSNGTSFYLVKDGRNAIIIAKMVQTN